MLQSYLSDHLISPTHLKCALILIPCQQLPTSLHLHNCSIFMIAQVKLLRHLEPISSPLSDLQSFNNSLHGSIFKIQLESYLLLLPPSQISDLLPGTLQMLLKARCNSWSSSIDFQLSCRKSCLKVNRLYCSAQKSPRFLVSLRIKYKVLK